ncbi:Bax inhibitor-1 family protein [Halomicroarcula sp. F13]|uniref:Bax inhibitor-1 family protein n=1 Tax=Haloarcula rubra TaxID=2487747 RepID=A0AAW4PRX7_9EURY|nr:Bax inhibitor-1 family protein [Halomicroarcula rubra]MBX0323748.1 Bax inhibitor-1 family protein [Halomicroarcula rubra]
MSSTFDRSTLNAGATVDRNISKIIGMGTALVAVNILVMLGLSYTPIAPLGAALFSSFFVGIAVFAVTVGGGFWIATKGVERGSMGLAGVGVLLIQGGYGLFGAAILYIYGGGLRVPALGITTVVTGAITAVVATVVFKSNYDFSGWQRYAFGCFIGGLVVGAAGVFLNPILLVVAGLLFFLGFVVDLTYEIWAVRENRYASDLRNAIGIYVAVMGVFVHVLQWVLRILSMLNR